MIVGTRIQQYAAESAADADQSDQEPPGVPTNCQFEIVYKQPVKDVSVSLQQSGSELKQFDFITAFFTSNDRLEVQLHSGVRSAPAEQSERIPGQFRLSEK